MNGSNLLTSGTPMAIGDAAVTAVLGYFVVFLGICLLLIAVTIMGKIMVAKQSKAESASPAPAANAGAAAVSAKKADPAPGSAGELQLYDTPERDAAMIMAIVADSMGRPLNELRFKSIKEVK